MKLIPERMVNGVETTAAPHGEPAALQSTLLRRSDLGLDQLARPIAWAGAHFHDLFTRQLANDFAGHAITGLVNKPGRTFLDGQAITPDIGLGLNRLGRGLDTLTSRVRLNEGYGWEPCDIVCHFPLRGRTAPPVS
ncbi:hypothetical protein D3C85_953730 [compost metagenome]|jgi:hypothetical protein